MAQAHAQVINVSPATDEFSGPVSAGAADLLSSRVARRHRSDSATVQRVHRGGGPGQPDNVVLPDRVTPVPGDSPDKAAALIPGYLAEMP